MVKIKISEEVWADIKEKHKKYMEENYSKELEEKIKNNGGKRGEFLKKLFGETAEKRKKELVEFCTSSKLEEKIKNFDGTFKQVYNFQYKINSEHKKIINDTRKDLDEILNYSKFNVGIAGWNRHIFIRSLGVRVCPYCNRQYITSYKEEKMKKQLQMQIITIRKLDIQYCK